MGVTSGRVETGTLRNSKFYVAWQQKEQIIPENYTDINWQAGLNNGDSWYLNAVKINNVVIDGETVSNGGTWSNITTKGDVQLLSGTKRIYHNSNGKKTFSVSISGWLYSYSNTSGSGTFELNDIPRQANITSAPDFNDEENPTIKYNNSAGTAVTSLQACISLTGSKDDIPYRDINKTGSSYTFELTDSERETLRNAVVIDNTLNVIFYVKTVINGVTYYSTLPKQMTLINANPTFDNWTYQDTNKKTLELTKNNQVVIKNYSKITGTISTANKAVAKKGATMSKYILNIGDNQAEAAFSNTANVTTAPAITATEKVFIMFAQDSRKLTKSKPIFVSNDNYKQYTEINIKEAKATRTGGVGTEVTLEFNGYIWDDSFGAEENDIDSCKYRYKKANEDTWTESDQNLTPVKSGNSYSLTTTIKGDLGAEGFTRDDSFDIELIITDKLSTYTYPLTLGSGKPNMAIHKNGVALGAPYDTEEGGPLQVDGKRIKPTIQACYVNAKTEDTYPQASYIPFTTKRYDNSNGKIVFNNNGTITINHTGYIKVSFNVWIWGGSDARPWVQFKNYTDNIIYIDAIDDTSSGYNNFSVSDCIIPVTSGKQFGLYVSANTNFGVNNGSGRGNSYMTIELM